MTYIYQTYRDDQLSACISASRLRELDPSAQIMFVNDKDRPADEQLLGDFGRVVRAEVSRGGNLNGWEQIQAQLRLFSSCEGFAVKVDSDVWLNSVDWLNQAQAVDLLWLEKREPFTPTGMIYSVSAAAARLMLAFTEEWSKAGGEKAYKFPEDMSTYHIASAAGLIQRLVPWSSRHLVGFRDGGDMYSAAAIHVGEPLLTTDGKYAAVPREHVLLRMQFLALLHGASFNGIGR